MLLRTRILLIFGVATLTVLLAVAAPFFVVQNLSEAELAEARRGEQTASFAKALSDAATPYEILSDRVAVDPALASAASSGDMGAAGRLLAATAAQSRMARLDLLGAEGRLLASSVGMAAETPMIDPTNLRSRLRPGTWLAGLETDAGGRLLIAVTTGLAQGGFVTVAGPADPIVNELARGERRRVFVVDREEHLMLSSSKPDWPALRAALARSGDGTASLEQDGRSYQAISTKLVNTAGLQIATLISMGDVTASAQRRSLVLLVAGGATALAFATLLLALYGFINGALDPLSEITRVIRAMAAGDSLVSADLPDRRDEVGAIAGAVEVFRRDIVTLARTKLSETMRQAQQRVLIRDEMERLAGMLEDGEREALIAELGGIEAASAEGGTALAVGFRSMAARVVAQHGRLAGLLADRTKDLEVVRQALAERAQLSRLRQELEVARNLQLSSLPQVFPPFPDRTDFEIYAAMEPAREVGGDFYDFALVGDDRLAIMIGDASGKGVSAAMFIAIARSILRSAIVRGASPAQAIALANSALAVENHTMMFATVFVGILDLTTGWLTYANGGHNPPYLVSEATGVRALGGITGIALGIMEDAEYDDEEILVPEAASLVLFTDGVTEANAADDSMFGEAQLEDALARLAGAGPEVTVAAIQQAVRRFADGVEQADDITVLSARFLGPVTQGGRVIPQQMADQPSFGRLSMGREV